MANSNGTVSDPFAPLLEDPDAGVNIGDGGSPGEGAGAPDAAPRPRPARLAGNAGRNPAKRADHAQGRARKSIEGLKGKALERIVYPPDDDDFECRYPFLWEGMTMFSYADGTPRMPWEVSVRRISGGYVATITDHDLLQKLRVSVCRWEDIQQGLETQLLAANPGWEAMEKSYRNKKGLDKFKKKA